MQLRAADYHPPRRPRLVPKDGRSGEVLSGAARRLLTGLTARWPPEHYLFAYRGGCRPCRGTPALLRPTPRASQAVPRAERHRPYTLPFVKRLRVWPGGDPASTSNSNAWGERELGGSNRRYCLLWLAHLRVTESRQSVTRRRNRPEKHSPDHRRTGAGLERGSPAALTLKRSRRCPFPSPVGR